MAAEDGVELAESELIGLAPLAAFLAVADHADAPAARTRSSAAWPPRPRFLRLRDFSPMQALELRLEAARAGRPDGGERRTVPASSRAAGATSRRPGC